MKRADQQRENMVFLINMVEFLMDDVGLAEIRSTR